MDFSIILGATKKKERKKKHLAKCCANQILFSRWTSHMPLVLLSSFTSRTQNLHGKHKRSMPMPEHDSRHYTGNFCKKQLISCCNDPTNGKSQGNSDSESELSKVM